MQNLQSEWQIAAVHFSSLLMRKGQPNMKAHTPTDRQWGESSQHRKHAHTNAFPTTTPTNVNDLLCKYDFPTGRQTLSHTQTHIPMIADFF